MTLINLINLPMTWLFDLLCKPFQGFAPVWAMIFLSAVTGVIMVWIFGKTSNQEAIKRVRDMIRGNLIGVRLFQNDVSVVMALQGRIVVDTMHYMRHSLWPMLIMMVPVVLIIVQLHLRFAVGPLEPGAQAVVKAVVRDPAAIAGNVTLDAPDGVIVETPAVRIASKNEVFWRIRGTEPGIHTLTLNLDGESVEKTVVVGDRWGSISQRRTGAGWWDVLLYPGEKTLAPGQAVESITISYPELELSLFGWNINWLVLFFVLSIVFGFALKGPMGVEV